MARPARLHGGCTHHGGSGKALFRVHRAWLRHWCLLREEGRHGTAVLGSTGHQLLSLMGRGSLGQEHWWTATRHSVGLGGAWSCSHGGGHLLLEGVHTVR